jgi:hypothetical protein
LLEKFDFSSAPRCDLGSPGLGHLSPACRRPGPMAPAPAPGSRQLTGGPTEALSPQVGHQLPGPRRRPTPAPPTHRLGSQAEALPHPLDEGVESAGASPAPHARVPLPLRFLQQRFDAGAAPEDPLVRQVRLSPSPKLLDRLPAADASAQSPRPADPPDDPARFRRPRRRPRPRGPGGDHARTGSDSRPSPARGGAPGRRGPRGLSPGSAGGASDRGRSPRGVG